MAEIVKANIANALNSLSGVLGTADQIQSDITNAEDSSTASIFLQDVILQNFEKSEYLGIIPKRKIIDRGALSEDVERSISIRLTGAVSESSSTIVVCYNDLIVLNHTHLFITFFINGNGSLPNYIKERDIYILEELSLSNYTAIVRNSIGGQIIADLSPYIQSLIENPDTNYNIPITFNKVSVLEDGEVTTEKLAPKAVTANKILEGSINSSHIISGGIQNNHLASNAVSESKLSNDVVYKLNGLNIGQIVLASGNEVVFASQEEFDKLEDLFKYNYYVEGAEGRLKLTPYLDNSTAIIIDNQTFYRCLFEYEDKYMNWDSDPVAYNKKCATTHGFVIPTYCRYDEPYIIFKFAGTAEEKAECANMVNAVIGHAYKADYSQYFPSTT